MKQIRCLHHVLIIIAVTLFMVPAWAEEPPETVPPRVSFEPNLGQASSDASYLGRGPGMRLLLLPTGATVLPVEATPGVLSSSVTFVGSNPAAALDPVAMLPGQVHYLSGQRTENWITDVPTYGGVVYRDLYPGIEAEFIGQDTGFVLRFDVAPQTSPDSIVLQWDSPETMSLDLAGDLLVRASGVDVGLQRPLVRQWVDNSPVMIDAEFIAHEDGNLGLQIAAYDDAAPLEIAIAWVPPATRWIDTNDATVLTVGDNGSVFVAGRSGSWSIDSVDAFVMRMDPSGATPLSTTYFGADNDVPLALAAAADGELVVAGRSQSRSGASDAFVARLDAAGSSWVYSTVIGGSADDEVRGVVLDNTSNAWIVGTTHSNDFPVDPEAIQAEIAGPSDLFIARLSRDGSERTHTSFLGGAADDDASAITIDADGNLWVAGATRTPQSDWDGFISRIRSDDGIPELLLSLGGTADDVAKALASAPGGGAFISGWTDSLDLPATADALQPTSGGGRDGFVARLGQDGRIEHVTYLGGSGADRVSSVAVDASGTLWVAGSTSSDTIPGTQGRSKPGQLDGYLAKLEAADLSSLRTTLIGHEGEDRVDQVALTSTGAPLVSGNTSSRRPSGMQTLESVSHGDSFVSAPIEETLLAAGCPGTINFDNSLGTFVWTSANNWDTDTLPTSTDDVCIDGFAVTLSASATVMSLTTVSAGSLSVSSGTLTLSSASQIDGALTQSGGTITGAGDLTVLGAFSWSGGTLSGTGELKPQGGLSLSGTTGKFLSRTLNNSGTTTATQTNNSFYLAAGGVFNNMLGATFDSQIDIFVNYGGGSPVFVNDGTFVKTGGTGTTSFSSQILFNNDGVLDVQTGTFQFNRGGTHNGSFDCTGATLRFNSGTHNLSALETLTGTDVYFGSGTVNLPGGYDVTSTTTIAGGTVNFTGSITNIGTAVLTSGTLNLSNTEGVVSQPTFDMTGGTLTGSSDFDVTGAMTWTGGTISGTGELNPQGGLSLSGTTGKFLSRTLNNSGTTTATQTNNSFYLAAGGVFDNMLGATFDSQIDIFVNYGGGSPVFVNDGTFVKSGGTGTTSLTSQIVFDNDGVLDVQTGTFQFNRGGTHNGSFDCTGATLRFNSGTHNLSALETLTGTDVYFGSGTVNLPGGYDVTSTTTIAGGTVNFTGSITNIGTAVLTSGTLNLSNTEGVVSQPTFDMTGGTLTGSSDFDVTGAMTWTGGTISGTGELNPQGGLSLSGTTGKFLSRTLNNSGTTTATQTNNSFYLAAGGVFNNMLGATFDSQIDIFVNYGGGSPVFVNDGTFVKTGGTGTTSFSSQILFNNDGVLDVQTGTFQFNRGGTHNGSFDCTGATLRFNSGTHNLSALETLTGTDVYFGSGTVNLPGGYDVTSTTTIAGGTVNFTGSITNIGTAVLTSGTLNLSNTEGVVSQPTFDMTGGTLTGSSDFDVTGAMTWTGGTISGTGELNPQGGLSLSGTTGKFLSRTLNNSGTTTATQTNNSFYLAAGGVFNNMLGATFDSQIDIFVNYGGGSPVFVNDGTFVKTGGTGTTSFSSQILFNNDGVLDVQTGTFQFNRGGTHNGSFDCTGATLRFNSGTHNLSALETLTGTDVYFGSSTVNIPGGYNVTGATTVAGATANFIGSIANIGTIALTSGTLNLSNTEGLVTQSTFSMPGGTLTGSSDFNVTGAIIWTGGTLSGAGELNSQGGLSISGTAAKFLSRKLNNSGTTTSTQTNNSLYFAANGVFNNMLGATFDAQSNTFYNFGGGSPSFNNSGLFVKSTGAGATTLANQIQFTNDGAIEALSGTLSIGDFTQTAGSTTLNGGAFSSATAMDFDGGLLTGVGTVTSSTVNTSGQVAPGVSAVGVLAVTGAYVSDTSTAFKAQLGGVGCTDSDRLDVTGAVTLDGALQVTLVDGCMPIPGQSFILITGSSVSGNFASFTPPATDCPVDWNIVYNPGSVVLEVITGVCNDGDGDTFSDCCGTCAPAVGDQCTDCDDADPLTYPGATELCDGTDNDCDTTVPSNEIDDDGDLYVECTAWNDTQGDAPTILGGDDCDDADITSYPGASEVCDGNDNDCDSVVPVDELDSDSDLYVVCSGWDDTQGDQAAILAGNDCDNADAASHPGATEVCDGNNNDCSAGIPSDELDGDSDQYVECSGWNDTQSDDPTILGGADCDDADNTSYPTAAELCDGNDNDCDTVIPSNELDVDSDLYVECSGWSDTQGNDPTILGGADCDDTDNTSYPTAAELCDGNDNDCDTTVPSNEIDDDGDLYVECTAWNDTQGDAPTILGGDDCDDADITSFPGASEVCDGNDNDCDSVVPVDEIDSDADLYVVCSGWDDTQGDQAVILAGNDCDNADAASHPGAAEVCDGNNNDCSAGIPSDELDGDSDQYVECSGWSDTQSDDPSILGGADCDDGDSASYPTASEVCDGNDNDCDTVTPSNELDGDSDQYVECSGWSDTQGNDPTILGGADCDDSDSASYPTASEVCDGNDNDCDTVVPTNELDGDSDQYVECAAWNDTQGDQPGILGGDDCSADDAISFPGAAEICDGLDNSCSGTADDGDADMDGTLVCDDCNDGNGDVFAIPSETQGLRFTGADMLQWSAPAQLGGSSVNYDVLRSGASDDFVSALTCVESDDGSDSQALDASVPTSGGVFYYLSRAENACGAGTPGTDSGNVERAADTCP